MASDLMSRKALLEAMNQWARENFSMSDEYGHVLQGMYKTIDLIRQQPTVEPMKWIPVKLRSTTEEDGVNMAECPFMLDCPLPDEECEILICTINGFVTVDEFCRDGVECYLDSGHDWDEIAAWMPLPEPDKDGEE